MGAVLNSIYSKFASPGLLAVLNEYQPNLEFIVEAGCHDGADTELLLLKTNVKKIFAFEPDIAAAEVAENRFRRFEERVQLRRVALLDHPGWARSYAPNGTPGDGSTIFKKLETNQKIADDLKSLIEVSTLDAEIKVVSESGALWLDVEGSAHLVLAGGQKTLGRIQTCQIEIDMHDISEYRKANYREVHKIMKRSSFSLLYAPIHPGFFGDTIYVKANLLSKSAKIRSLFLETFFILLHSYVYPLMRKPI